MFRVRVQITSPFSIPGAGCPIFEYLVVLVSRGGNEETEAKAKLRSCKAAKVLSAVESAEEKLDRKGKVEKEHRACSSIATVGSVNVTE